jgi:hypothetical protein
MLRHCSRVIALAVMLIGLTTAQAADTTLTLACKGTTTDTIADKPEPVSMGIIVNFTKRTVQGFGDPEPVKITAWNDVTVSFSGGEDRKGAQTSIFGSIDRVTGDVGATSLVINAKGEVTYSLNYTLKCRPAQRMF